jgi:hypothetical protein
MLINWRINSRQDNVKGEIKRRKLAFSNHGQEFTTEALTGNNGEARNEY